MKPIILAAVLAALALPAQSQEYTAAITPRATLPAALTTAVELSPEAATPPDEPVLIGVHRGKRTKRHPLGKKVYVYRIDATHTVEVDKKLKAFRDARPWPEQHPIKHTTLKTRKAAAFWQPIINIGMDIALLLMRASH